jgi:acylphosphatase
METVHLLISGKVQGVFYRDSARKVAQKLTIKGWIKNRKDEKVEALVSGEKNELDDFINWCKSGPERAKVKEVVITKYPITIFDKFEIKREK